MKILFLTGSRGEWGYIRPILQLCKHRHIDYSICTTNMQLLPSNGLAVNEIVADGFDVEDRIYMSLEGHNHFSMAKSLGVFLTSFVDTLARVKPDWLLLAGDRGEQLMGALQLPIHTPRWLIFRQVSYPAILMDLHVMLLVSLCICILLLMRMPNNVY